MPRPKPPEPLSVRQIRLSDTHWIAFQSLGGAQWLRNRLVKLNLTGIAKRERNRRIKSMSSYGASDAEIARVLGVHRSTVGRNS